MNILKYMIILSIGQSFGQHIRAEAISANLLYGLTYATMYGVAGTLNIFLDVHQSYRAWSWGLIIVKSSIRTVDPMTPTQIMSEASLDFAKFFLSFQAHTLYERKIWEPLRDTYIPKCADKMYEWGMRIPRI